MKRWMTITAAISAAALTATASAATDATLDKIGSTKTITLGVKDASGVVSFTTGGGQYAGYHLDICNRVVENVRKALALNKLNVKYVSVTNVNRIPLLTNGTFDLGCGTMAHTTERAKQIAYAPTTWVETMPALVKVSSGMNKIADLTGKVVATASGSTAVKDMREYSEKTGRKLDVRGVKDNAEAFFLLESGRADAFVNDGQILASFRASAPNPSAFKILNDQVFGVEPQAIYYRLDNPAFGKIVDSTVADLESSGEIEKIYKKWFLEPVPPRKHALELPPSEVLRDAWNHPNKKPMEDYSVEFK